MNQRILFFLSVIIIAVGITGIVIQKHPTSSDDNLPATHQEVKKKVIVIAETLKDLKSQHILSDKDYQIRVSEIDQAAQDIRDISSLGTNNLNGYLIRNSLPKNSVILPTMLEAPGSATFALHSLKPDELLYTYQVKPQDASLLTSLAVGDEVSLYIRLTENQQGQLNTVGMGTESTPGQNKNGVKYTLSRLSGPLSIIEIAQDKNQVERGGYGQDETVGRIVLRVNLDQLAALRVVEKVGDILVFPTRGDKHGKEKISMDEVLPQLHVVKELRGDK